MEKQNIYQRTSRLSLRPLQVSDAESLQRIYLEDGVLRYFPNPVPPPLEKIQRWLAAQEAHWETHSYGNWSILPVGESGIIGWAGLQFLPELNQTEVGYLLDRDYWGKGYATEVVRASVAFGFKSVRLDHIIALVHPENAASRRVLEKCGISYRETKFLWGLDLMQYQLDGKDFLPPNE